MKPGSTWQERVDSLEQVVVTARAGLEDRESGGRVRHEHAQQAVLFGPDEIRALAGQVAHGGRVTGPD
jgi:hypothetical protein